MPRRNAAPVQRNQSRRVRLPRKGSTITVWNSLGQPIQCVVLHANHHWIDLKDLASGERTWIASRELA